MILEMTEEWSPVFSKQIHSDGSLSFTPLSRDVLLVYHSHTLTSLYGGRGRVAYRHTRQPSLIAAVTADLAAILPQDDGDRDVTDLLHADWLTVVTWYEEAASDGMPRLV